MMRRFTTTRALGLFLFALLGGLFFAPQDARAQFTGSYAFPQDVEYTWGRMPSNANSQDALDAYNYWKTNFVTSSGACGERRVKFDFYPGGRGSTDGSTTVSEGIAYGMLLAAYAGDKSLFDDLWAYYNKFLNGNGVMNWKIENCGVIGWNGASDAELDVAMALIVASYQWQSDFYLNEAKDMIRVIRQTEFENFQSNSPILKPGDQFGGFNLVNPSYFSPAYYRVFADYDQPQYAQYWENAAEYGYDIIALAGGSNGLVPDWCRADGSFSNQAGSYEDDGQNFIFDAIRTPFRSAIDVLWHNSESAREYCTKIVDWAYDNNSGGTEGLGSKYSTSGQKLNSDHSNTFVSCFAIAGMAADPTMSSKSESNYQSFIDRGYTDNETTTPGYGQYFNATFKAIGHFVMSGNFWLPPPDECTAPDLGGDRSLCEGSSIQLNATLTGVNYEWRKNGSVLVGQNNQTFSANSAGEYEVITTDSQGCTRRDKVSVYDAAIDADFSFSVQASTVVLTNTTTGGITDATWNDGTSDFASTIDAEYVALQAGSYDITLTVDNSGFGCAQSDVVTKTIIVGDGEGWVADDFNDYSYAELWTAPGGNYDALPTTWCSRDDFDAGSAKVCSDMPCSYYQIVANGGAASAVQYQPFGINFREDNGYVTLNVDATPFVSIKLKSSAAVELGVGLGDATLTTNRIKVSLDAGVEQVVTLDFTNNKSGYLDEDNQDFPVDFTALNQIAFFPYEFDTDYEGTIDIDWIIVGGKSLSPPEFDLKVDELGFAVFEYDPTNPNFDEDDEDFQYFRVSSWEEEVLACGLTAEVTANACTAEEITWFNGVQVVATGETAELAPGTYTVELKNPGGVTTADVTVESANVVADFDTRINNFQVHFENQSSDFDSFEWNYGDTDNDLPGSTLWDIGFHDYETAGEGTYTVSLTVENETCGTSDTETKMISLSCSDLPGEPVVVDSETEVCEGDEVTFSIDPVEFASAYGWFGPNDATVVEDSLTATITFGKQSGPVSVQAYANCGGIQTETTVAVDVIPQPVGDFLTSVNQLNQKEISFIPDVAGATEYSWDFGDGSGSSEEDPTHLFADEQTYTVCLTVTNECGTGTENCAPVDIIIGFDEQITGELNVFPTLTTNVLTVTMTKELSATLRISDVTGNAVMESVIEGNGDIDVSNLVPGVYVLSIEKGEQIVTKRFVKQ